MSDEERERPANPNRYVHPDQGAAERARAPQNAPGTIPGDLASGNRPGRDATTETPEHASEPAPRKGGRKRSVQK